MGQIHHNRQFHNLKTDKQDTQLEPHIDKPKYQALVGSLLYIARMWRPDISYAFRILCRSTNKPTQENWEDAMHLLRYLFHTESDGITITY